MVDWGLKNQLITVVEDEFSTGLDIAEINGLKKTFADMVAPEKPVKNSDLISAMARAANLTQTRG